MSYLRHNGFPDYKLLRRLLSERFPGAILPEKQPKRILSVNILSDMRRECADIPERHLKWFLRFYCSGASYWSAMVENASRYNLSGTAVGFVTKDHARHAAAKLKDLEKKHGR